MKKITIFFRKEKNFIEEVALTTASLSFSPPKAGFPKGVANMGGSSKFDAGEGGLSQNMGGAWGEHKMLLKNTCEGVI